MRFYPDTATQVGGDSLGPLGRRRGGADEKRSVVAGMRSCPQLIMQACFVRPLCSKSLAQALHSALSHLLAGPGSLVQSTLGWTNGGVRRSRNRNLGMGPSFSAGRIRDSAGVGLSSLLWRTPRVRLLARRAGGLKACAACRRLPPRAVETGPALAQQWKVCPCEAEHLACRDPLSPVLHPSLRRRAPLAEAKLFL